MSTATLTAPTPDFAAIKARQQATWASGDYAVVGTTLQIVGETLCEAVDLRAGATCPRRRRRQRQRDARGGAPRSPMSTSTDYVGALLDGGRERAAAERLPVTFKVADAEALPFADASFDVVLSTFGVMFTPDHAKAASEMLRVCRPGGRIGLANWTPDGFIGQLFKMIGAHVPPPAGVKSPALWGTQAHLDALFGQNAERRGERASCSCSATARQGMSLTCSARSTGPSTRRSRRSMQARPSRSSATFSRSSRSSTSRRTARWWYRAPTSRSSRRGADPAVKVPKTCRRRVMMQPGQAL